MVKPRSDSLTEQLDQDRIHQLRKEAEQGHESREQMQSPAISPEVRMGMDRQIQLNADNQARLNSNWHSQMPADMNAKPRRRSIFELRGPLGQDRFSREYADAMDDMWMAECDQGDAGHAGKGLMQGTLFQRRVSLGQDEFSREYFDAMEDTFVAESDHGDAGFLHGNPHQPTFNRIPDGLRRLSQTLSRPVKLGTDEFSREYAREAEDNWLAQSGKGPSARAPPSELMRRVRLTSSGDV